MGCTEPDRRTSTLTISMKKILRTSQPITDRQVASVLNESLSQEDFSPQAFERSVGLKPLRERPMSMRVIRERLGASTERGISDEDADTFLQQTYLFLPTNLPPIIMRPLGYLLARIAEDKMRGLKVVYSDSPITGIPVELERLFRLYLISEESVIAPWWLAVIETVAKGWERGSVLEFWDRLYTSLSRQVNAIHSMRIVRVLNALNVGPSIGMPKVSMVRNYIEANQEHASTFYSVVANVLREILVPGFSTVGIRRGFTTDRVVQENDVLYTAQGIRMVRGYTPHMRHVLMCDDIEVPEGVTEVHGLRASLRTSLSSGKHWRCENFLDDGYESVHPASEVGWIVQQEPARKSRLLLSPMQVQVLGAGWAGLGLARTRNKILELLGMLRATASTYARELMKKGLVSVGFFPRHDLIMLHGHLLIHLTGESGDLLQFRALLESGVPYVESSMGVDGDSFFALVGLPHDYPHLVASYISKGLRGTGLDMVRVDPVAEVRRLHMRAVMRCLL